MEKQLEKVQKGSMRRWPVGFLAAALTVSVSAAPNPNRTDPNKTPVTPNSQASPVAKLKSSIMNMPLSFEVNQGQTDAKVKFLTRAQNFTVLMTPTEIVMRGLKDDVLRMQLRNANQSPNIVGEDKQLKVTNYYLGSDRSKWLEGVSNYGQVRYQGVYSGIDLVYHSDQRALEYDFVVAPGADPNQIRVAFEGTTGISITKQGELELKSAAGTSVNHKPVIYQTINGQRKTVAGEFILANNNVGFKIGEYDRTQPLVIDPTLQVISFFGGVANDEAAGIAASGTSNAGTGVVFVGRAQSLALPGAGGTINVNKNTVGLSWDAYATGLNGGTSGLAAAAGTTIIYTTYFGGSGDDAARGVAVDNQGNAYVAGYTNSANFPTVPATSGFSSNYDAFVAKLGATGGISAATLYGGPGVDMANSIALDYSTFSKLGTALSISNPASDPRVTPNVVIGGVTSGGIGLQGSPVFAKDPASAGLAPAGNQPNFNTPQSGQVGTTDGFVAIFNTTLQVVAATYIGGGGNDQVNGVAVDVWGNIYATGYATPGVPALIPPSTTPNFFPVVNGIGQAAGVQNSLYDASRVPQGQSLATAFVAKWVCTTGTSPNGPIGVTSPPFGVTNGVNSVIPVCGGGNNLLTLSNSALFGGSALGGTFINPEQILNGLPGITEAGLGIAVDQNGWGQAGVTSVVSQFNGWGFPDIVPNTESNAACNIGTTGYNGIATVGPVNGGHCAVSTSQGTSPTPPGNGNLTNIGGFQPGLSGPHVYVVGNTASRDFVNGLINASCIGTPQASTPNSVPPLCDTPQVWGSAVVTNGGQPTGPFCDPVSFCSLTTPKLDLRVRTVANGTSNSGQTQGWLAAFQFPAVTTELVTPPPVGTCPGATCNTVPTASVNTLSPPTIPVYIVLQPPTCPQQAPGAGLNCLDGSNLSTDNVGNLLGGGFSNASPAPAANFGCQNLGNGITCPNAFIGSWNAVAVDTDQQVYVAGQIGLAGARNASFTFGAPTRLALEIERISPYSNTTVGVGYIGTTGYCPVTQPACAFPEPLFPNAGAPTTTSFVVDAGNGGSNYGQLLPGAPPKPDPNQPGGIGNGIAVNAFREAFFVGTTSATNPTANVTATATASVVAGQIQITLTTGGNPSATSGSGYTTAPTITLTGLTGCTTAPGPFTTTIVGGAVTAIANNPSGAGCTIPAPTVSFTAAPGAASPLVNSTISTAIAPVPAIQRNLGATGGTNNTTAAAAVEDVIYGAIQFYDAIAGPSTAINFTATVNNVSSILGPNSDPSNPTTTGLNAKAFITYTNWEGQALNIPPGCQIIPFAPAGNPLTGAPAFTVNQLGNTASFQVNVNPAAVTAPGVVTSLVVFQKTGPCTGAGQQPLDSWDPVTVTLSVSSSLNVTSEDTFGTITNPLTSGILTGLVDQFVADGHQLAANQTVTTFLDVATATTPSGSPMNFTVQIVPGVNWAGTAATTVSVPTPQDIIYEVSSAANAQPTQIPVVFNTLNIGRLPQGTYTAYILITPTPETPALPSAGSLTCGATIIGTSNASCIPIVIKVGPSQSVNVPGAIVFGASTTPQQTGLQINNPVNSAGPFNFTTFYTATPVIGTALPAANVFYVGTGSTLTSAIGNTVAGSVAVGGSFTIPIQVNPAGLPTGVYSGTLSVSNNGAIGGATPQTTVALIVYVGPKTGDDLPTANGLGLTLPVNVPPVGTGALPGTAAGSSPGAYGITINVASGFGPLQVPDPTLIEVTGLNNTVATPYAVNAPVVLGPNKTGTLPGVSITNVGIPVNNFGTVPSACADTHAQLSSLSGAPLGPPCVWSVWVDATTLNSTNTARTAACGVDPLSNQNQFGENGFLRFTPVVVGPPTPGIPFATFDVPIQICVSDEPALILGMPTTFPNPTFGPITGTNNFIGQPSNLGNGFPLSIVEMELAASTGSSNGSTVNGGITLFSTLGNSGFVCKTLDLHTNGGIVPGVTINPLGNGPGQFLSIQQAPALFLGPSFNGLPALANPFTVNGLSLPGTPPFAAGPFQANIGLQTFNVCANTDPLGNVMGTFHQNLVISGGQVGAITVPVNFTIGPPGGGPVGPPVTPAKFSQLGIFRAANATFALDRNGNNTFDLPADKVVPFGTAGDIPVSGDWDGTGVIRIGVFRPANGHWYLDMNNNGVWDGAGAGLDADIQFGATTNTCVPSSAAGLSACLDIPVVGDWNGNGVTKLGIYRGIVGQWYLDNQNPTQNGFTGSHSSFTTETFGGPGDLPVAANWGAGVCNGVPANGPVVQACDQIGVYRKGLWIVNNSGTGAFNAATDCSAQASPCASFVYGDSASIPVTGNWNGTGAGNAKRIGVFNSLGQWFVDINGDHVFTNGVDSIYNFGVPGDLPVVGFWTLP